MTTRNDITYSDDMWERGKSYDAETGEFMSCYVRLKKIMGNKNPTIFDHESYGRGTGKPNNDYFDIIEKYHYKNDFKERWKREDYCPDWRPYN